MPRSSSIPPTAFVGREAELERLEKALQTIEHDSDGYRLRGLGRFLFVEQLERFA